MRLGGKVGADSSFVLMALDPNERAPKGMTFVSPEESMQLLGTALQLTPIKPDDGKKRIRAIDTNEGPWKKKAPPSVPAESNYHGRALVSLDESRTIVENGAGIKTKCKGAGGKIHAAFKYESGTLEAFFAEKLLQIRGTGGLLSAEAREARMKRWADFLRDRYFGVGPGVCERVELELVHRDPQDGDLLLLSEAHASDLETIDNGRRAADSGWPPPPPPTPVEPSKPRAEPKPRIDHSETSAYFEMKGTIGK